MITRIKEGVSLKGIKPETVLAINLSQRTAERLGVRVFTITSVVREKGKGSVHPYGYAFDHTVEPNPENYTEELKWDLGEQYDIIGHDAGSGWHVHEEFDPR